VVFESIEDLRTRIDDPALEVDENSVLVLKGCGPRASGMPEVGTCRCRAKLLERGVRDMLRISDARRRHCIWDRGPARGAEAEAGGPAGIRARWR